MSRLPALPATTVPAHRNGGSRPADQEARGQAPLPLYPAPAGHGDGEMGRSGDRETRLPAPPSTPPLPRPGASSLRDFSPPASNGALTDPRPDLAARFGDGARWSLLLTLAHETDPAAGQAAYDLRAAGAQIISQPQPGDLTPEGPVPLWRLGAGVVQPAAWPRLHQHLVAPHAALLARWLVFDNPEVNDPRLMPGA